MNVFSQITIVTLDGPSGTGKGTLCHLLAKHLHWNLLDSGAIYRTLAYAARKKRIDLHDHSKLIELAHSLDLHFESTNNNQSKIYLENEEISMDIRSEQIGEEASKIAQIPQVRIALLERQRQFAKPPGLVTDGRDMGTVVFPNANLKIFLHASLKERAHRRQLQLKEKGIYVSLAKVVEELHKRDSRDSTREYAPLKAAPDAIQIDTTGLNISQVFQTVLNLLVKHGISNEPDP